MKKLLATFGLAAAVAGTAHGQLIFSQYVETNSGTTPKGVEIWNAGNSTIDFSVNNLDILKGVNGGAPKSDFTLEAGTLNAGDVWVIGTSDIGTYLDNTFGAGVVNYSTKAFTFNGDDSLQIKLGGVVQDTFGTPGVDPGTAWTGGGVSTANQNIALKLGITTGDTDGWSDPSTRFETVSSDPVGAGGLDGFGVAPVPEPGTWALLALGGAFVLWRVGRKARRA
jgi:hypothetical protein